VWLDDRETAAAMLADADGAFTSWPLRSGAGLVRARLIAPGYLELESAIAKSSAAENRSVSLDIQLSHDRPGEVLILNINLERL
jgi:hypothetical protein